MQERKTRKFKLKTRLKRKLRKGAKTTRGKLGKGLIKMGKRLAA